MLTSGWSTWHCHHLRVLSNFLALVTITVTVTATVMVVVTVTVEAAVAHDAYG